MDVPSAPSLASCGSVLQQVFLDADGPTYEALCTSSIARVRYVADSAEGAGPSRSSPGHHAVKTERGGEEEDDEEGPPRRRRRVVLIDEKAVEAGGGRAGTGGDADARFDVLEGVRLCTVVPLLPRSFPLYDFVQQVVPCTGRSTTARPAPATPAVPLPVHLRAVHREHLWGGLGVPAAPQPPPLPATSAVRRSSSVSSSDSDGSSASSASERSSSLRLVEDAGAVVEWASSGGVGYTTDTEGLRGEVAVRAQRTYSVPPIPHDPHRPLAAAAAAAAAPGVAAAPPRTMRAAAVLIAARLARHREERQQRTHPDGSVRCSARGGSADAAPCICHWCCRLEVQFAQLSPCAGRISDFLERLLLANTAPPASGGSSSPAPSAAPPAAVVEQQAASSSTGTAAGGGGAVGGVNSYLTQDVDLCLTGTVADGDATQTDLGVLEEIVVVGVTPRGRPYEQRMLPPARALAETATTALARRLDRIVRKYAAPAAVDGEGDEEDGTSRLDRDGAVSGSGGWRVVFETALDAMAAEVAPQMPSAALQCERHLRRLIAARSALTCAAAAAADDDARQGQQREGPLRDDRAEAGGEASLAAVRSAAAAAARAALVRVSDALLDAILAALRPVLHRRTFIMYELLRLLSCRSLFVASRALVHKYRVWYAEMPPPGAVLHLIGRGNSTLRGALARAFPAYASSSSSAAEGPPLLVPESALLHPEYLERFTVWVRNTHHHSASSNSNNNNNNNNTGDSDASGAFCAAAAIAAVTGGASGSSRSSAAALGFSDTALAAVLRTMVRRGRTMTGREVDHFILSTQQL